MRKLKTVLYIFGLFLITTMSNAKMVDLKAVTAQEVVKRDLILAIETLTGKVVKTKNIVSLPKKARTKGLKILEQPQLELRSGSIIYPEEISKLYKVDKRKFRKIARIPKDEDE